MNAGDMDREITILTAAKSRDAGTGEEVTDWSADTSVGDSGVVWAEWLPAGTREAANAQQRIGSYVDGVFRTYDFSPRPTPDGTRILFEGRLYDVKPVMERGRNEYLEIPVVARAEGTTGE